jgi:hypothetical protein
MNKKLASCVILVLIALVAGCTLNSQLQTPAEMSPKGRAALAMTLYNNAWDNYQAQFAATPQPMSKDMVNYFQGYKAVMVTAEPMVRLYDSTVAAGGLPTPEQEQAIISMIYQLQAMLVKKGG